MEKITYEKALEKLEQIVEQLEQGSMPLEKSLELYEEANKLAVYCKQCLDNAEQKIVRLTQDGSEVNDFE